MWRKNLSGGSPKNHPMKKIDFFKSTSHVDFLKAHIKISFLYNSENFWTLPHWLAGSQRRCVRLIWELFQEMKFFTKNSPISSIFDQILQFGHTFQSIFHALHESNNIKLKIIFSTILDHIWYGLWRWLGVKK